MEVNKKEISDELDRLIESGTAALSKRQKKKLQLVEIALARIFKVLLKGLEI